ncbi:hypothetical protein HS141_11150 [Cetobacterium somerae]|uniref:hypothetical protein n=1 Tax=Cetobacterium somerae TaxID=188913 RepID=UPI00211EEB0C|nr:hypothetical protein [Cetobacterium somerae]MCQ9627489.1 hypothetical protein [Cetobacterium somerae]
MSKKYIYLASDLQLESFLLKKNMIISKEDLEKITKENEKAKDLFIETSDFPKMKLNSAFYLKKIEKAFVEVLNGI